MLLIEDDQDIRENMAAILSLGEHQVLQAEDGDVGVDLARAELPDLIITDIMMPRLDGFGVFEQLRGSQETAAIPVLFVTALSDLASRRRVERLHGAGFLQKPFRARQLLDAVDQVGRASA